MCKVREVYSYINTGISSTISLAPSSNNIGAILTNTVELQNNVFTLNDKKGNSVGKKIGNNNRSLFENNTGGFVSNTVFLFNDGSYVMTLLWINTTGLIPANTKYVSKAVSTGGRYAGKEVTVTLETNNTLTRKIIFEYEK
jgi:hypothetical protein